MSTISLTKILTARAKSSLVRKAEQSFHLVKTLGRNPFFRLLQCVGVAKFCLFFNNTEMGVTRTVVP